MILYTRLFAHTVGLYLVIKRKSRVGRRAQWGEVYRDFSKFIGFIYYVGKMSSIMDHIMLHMRHFHSCDAFLLFMRSKQKFFTHFLTSSLWWLSCLLSSFKYPKKTSSVTQSWQLSFIDLRNHFLCAISLNIFQFSEYFFWWGDNTILPRILQYIFYVCCN